MPAGHKMPGTRHSRWFDKKLTVRANCLKTVVFQHDWFACKQSQQQWTQSGTRNVNLFRLSNQLPKQSYSRLSNDWKWQRIFVETSFRNTRHNSDLKFR